MDGIRDCDKDSSDIPGQTILPTVTWEGCYDDNWKGIITTESFAHPAKMARGLLCRILDFMLEQGWLKRGDSVLDPFSGVGTTAIEAASRGLQAIGCELEERFHKFALANIELRRRTWEQFGDPMPVLLNGDSRRLSAVLQEATAVMKSPPYEGSAGDGTHGIDWSKHKQRTGTPSTTISPGSFGVANGYGTSPGQLGALPAGSVDAAISSPPYAESSVTGEHNQYKTRDGDGKPAKDVTKGYSAVVGSPPFSGTEQPCQSQSQAKKDYHAFTRGRGTKRDETLTEGTEGQLGSMDAGTVDSVVGSPPWEECDNDRGQSKIDFESKRQAARGRNPNGAGHLASCSGYGSSEGQLGAESGETFWSAAAQIVRECLTILKPGAYCAWVVKDFVRDGKRVEFSRDWLRLCVAVGFEPVLWVQASLVKEQREDSLFGGQEVKRTERKSFFRRLHERKLPEDDPRRIDHEDVIFVRKPFVESPHA